MTVVPSDVTTLGTYAQELLAACEDALATTVGGVPDRSFVSAGLPALDCCPQLTVHVQGVTAELTSPALPTDAGHRVNFGMLILTRMVVTIARCAPTVEFAGDTIVPPSAAELTASALEVDQDMWAIWNKLYTIKAEGNIFNGACSALYFDGGTPLDTEGGCAGWTFEVRAAIDGYDIPSGT